MSRVMALILILGVMLGAVAQPLTGESYFVTAEITPSQALVGQQLDYVVTAYSDTLRDVTLTPPDFPGMVQGDIRHVSSSVTLEGKQYNLVTFAVTVYPSRTGALTIPPAEVLFEGTLLTTPETRYTDAVTLTVDAPAESPTGFSGLVRRHDSTFSLDTASAELGQPIVAEYRIRGTGYVAGLPAPALILPEGWRSYLDPAHVTTTSEGTVTTSEKVFRWRVMPDRAGALRVGVSPLTVYDLPTGMFTDLTIDPLPIQVLAGPNGETVRASAQAALEVSGLGLPAATQGDMSIPPSIAWWFAPFGLLIVIGGQAFYQRVRANQRAIQRANAFATAKSRLSVAAKQSGDAALKAIEAAAAGYLRDKERRETPAIREALILVESARYAPTEVDTVRDLAAAVFAALHQTEGEIES